jgi:hypothetical protein
MAHPLLEERAGCSVGMMVPPRPANRRASAFFVVDLKEHECSFKYDQSAFVPSIWRTSWITLSDHCSLVHKSLEVDVSIGRMSTAEKVAICPPIASENWPTIMEQIQKGANLPR